jgi:hypothetical protein
MTTPLNTAHKIRRALEVYKTNQGGLRQAQMAAVFLFHSKKEGWRGAQSLYYRAGQLLNMLRNKSIAHVVQPK